MKKSNYPKYLLRVKTIETILSKNIIRKNVHIVMGLGMLITNKIRKDLHFWETYWVAINSLCTGGFIGFGLSGQQVREFTLPLTVMWCGMIFFSWFFRQKRIIL